MVARVVKLAPHEQVTVAELVGRVDVLLHGLSLPAGASPSGPVRAARQRINRLRRCRTPPPSSPLPTTRPSSSPSPEADPEDQIEVGAAFVGGGPARTRRRDPPGPAPGSATPRPPRASARCPSWCSTRAARPAPTSSRARSSSPARCATSAGRPARPDQLATARCATRAVYFLTASRARSASPRRRRSTTRATTSSRSPGSCARCPSRPRSSGVMLLPETDAQRLLVTDGALRGVRTGDKGRGRQGEELPDFEPGAEVVAQATVLADGVQGMLTDAARRPLRARGREPPDLRPRGQGGLEGRRSRWTGSSTRSAGRCARASATASSAAPSSTRWATTRSASAWSSGSTPPTPRSRCTTCCSAQAPPLRARPARGRRARGLGRQGDPRGRLLVAPVELVACRAG